MNVPRQLRDPVTDERVLTEVEIEELGLEQVPAGAGPSWEEIEQKRGVRHADR